MKKIQEKKFTMLNKSALIDPVRLEFPYGWVGHIPFASWLVSVLKPNTVVELGTHSGNSYGAFCQAIKENNLPTRAYAVDTWQGDEHAGGYDEQVFVSLKNHHDPAYGSFSQLLRMTFDEAAGRFPDGAIDLLHIDGLHTYEAVKHDFETWLPKLSARGVVLFHDTNVHERNFGVFKLWDELFARYPGFNFKHSHGLGVLLIGAEQCPEIAALVESTKPNENWGLASALFQTLGANIERRGALKDRDGQIANLHQAVAERDGQIAHLQQVVAERDGQIAILNQAMAERGAQIANLNQAAVERDAQIANLNQAVAERDAQIANLNQAVTERDGQITNLNQTVIERDGQITNLKRAVAEHDAQIASLTHAAEALRSPKSWRLTSPLRWVESLICPSQSRDARRLRELESGNTKR